MVVVKKGEVRVAAAEAGETQGRVVRVCADGREGEGEA